MDDEMRAAFAELEALMTAHHEQLIARLDALQQAIAPQQQMTPERAGKPPGQAQP
jgi:hypothetical protein